jgi:hypothetical protein
MKKRRLKMYSLDRQGFGELLARFEKAYADEIGEELTSEEFYARYRHGEIEGTAAMAWATYFEAFQQASEPRRQSSRRRRREAMVIVPESAIPRFRSAPSRS